MLIEQKKRISSLKISRRLGIVAVLVFSTLAESQDESMYLSELTSKELTVQEILDRATRQDSQDFQAQLPEKSDPILPRSFKNIDDLKQEKTFEALITDAEVQRKEILARQNMPKSHEGKSQIADAYLGSDISGPASNLSVVMDTKPLISSIPEKSLVVTNEQVEKKAKSSVDIFLKQTSVDLSVKEISVSVGEKLPVSIKLADAVVDHLNLFVRDSSIVAWDKSQRNVVGVKEGETEIYLHYKDQLVIVPVHVGSSHSKIQNLPVADTISVLKNLDSGLLLAQETVNKNKNLRSSRNSIDSLNLNDEKAFSTKDDYEYSLLPKPYESQKISFQILDDRSDLKGKIYPISDVIVQIIGSDYNKKTDIEGLTDLVEIPKHSNLIVKVSDPYDRYRSVVLEVPSLKLESGSPVSITLLRRSAYDLYSQISQVEPTQNTSSVCATVTSESGQPLSNINVTLDSPKARPIYVDSYGNLQVSADKTSSYGRFCVFNLEPGPFAFYFKKGDGSFEGPVPLNLFAGSHLEHRFILGEKITFRTAVAAPTSSYGNELRDIQYNSLLAFGASSKEWNYNPSDRTLKSQLESHEGRSYYMSNGNEFERTIYKIDADLETDIIESVTPLYPNGFLEDLAVESNIYIDPDRGSVIIDHGDLETEKNKSPVRVTLLDEHSNSVGDRAHLEGSSSSVFLNVAPGTYTVTVKRADGTLVSNNTVLVYSDTLSYLHTGSPIQRSKTTLSSN